MAGSIWWLSSTGTAVMFCPGSLTRRLRLCWGGDAVRSSRRGSCACGQYADDPKQRPGQPLHEPCLLGAPAGKVRADQHGRQRPCAGQQFHGAAVADGAPNKTLSTKRSICMSTKTREPPAVGLRLTSSSTTRSGFIPLEPVMHFAVLFALICFWRGYIERVSATSPRYSGSAQQAG